METWKFYYHISELLKVVIQSMITLAVPVKNTEGKNEESPAEIETTFTICRKSR